MKEPMGGFARIRYGAPVAQAGLCLGCAIVGLWVSVPLDGSEFSGGTVTGPVLQVHELAVYLFVLAAPLVVLRPRVGSGIALIACCLAVPLYLYSTAPVPFQMLFPGEYKYIPPSWFRWDSEAVIGLAVLMIAAILSVNRFRHPTNRVGG